MAHGHIRARFAVRNGATRLIEHYQNAPLKIARVLESEARPGGLDVCVMDCSPGLLAGDSHQFEWIVEEGAQVRITTQGATRVHPANSSFEQLASRQCIVARVASTARLELWPEAIIPFHDANFESHSEIWLEEGAHFSVFESLSAGRVARGELFQFERVALKTQILSARGPLFCAQNRFVPREGKLQNRFSFGGATHYASLVAFGENKSAAAAKIAQQILERRELYGAGSLLERGGVAISLLTKRAFDARCAALEIAQKWDVSRETNGVL